MSIHVIYGQYRWSTIVRWDVWIHLELRLLTYEHLRNAENSLTGRYLQRPTRKVHQLQIQPHTTIIYEAKWNSGIWISTINFKLRKKLLRCSANSDTSSFRFKKWTVRWTAQSWKEKKQSSSRCLRALTKCVASLCCCHYLFSFYLWKCCSHFCCTLYRLNVIFCTRLQYNTLGTFSRRPYCVHCKSCVDRAASGFPFPCMNHRMDWKYISKPTVWLDALLSAYM